MRLLSGYVCNDVKGFWRQNGVWQDIDQDNHTFAFIVIPKSGNSLVKHFFIKHQEVH